MLMSLCPCLVFVVIATSCGVNANKAPLSLLLKPESVGQISTSSPFCSPCGSDESNCPVLRDEAASTLEIAWEPDSVAGLGDDDFFRSAMYLWKRAR